MAIEGYYYLHENGSLIYKRGADSAADIRESDFAIALWPFDPTDRAGAWRILVEAGACGANQARIDELATLWGCTDDDAAHYADCVGCRLYMDGNAWCATRSDFENPQESPAGFGNTAIVALSALAKELGYKPSTMWGATFSDLLKPLAA